jgi:lysophospholipase L1-like esterase
VNAAIVTLCFAVAASAAELAFDPAETVAVQGETLKLTAVTPKGWAVGTPLSRLRTLRPGAGTPVHGALDRASVVVKLRGEIMKEGADYLLDAQWGMFGLAPGSRIKPEDEVTVDYRYSLLRLDSIVRAEGKESVRKGVSHLTRPEPPALGAGETRVANVFIPYLSDGRAVERFPILESAAQAVTASTPGRLPRALAKVKAGKPLKVVCWGDSVTAGGDASSEQTRYPAVLESLLREKFPGAQLAVETVAVGGSHSRQWLYPDKFRPSRPELATRIDWRRVVDAKPDVVTVEFVNDASLRPEQVTEVYSEILRRIEALGAEAVLITPHFTQMSMMGFTSLREAERRPYVLALRRFAEERRVALADASARWEHLWKEGLPYITLLHNAINHPDDRGHRLFAEELIKCVAP